MNYSSPHMISAFDSVVERFVKIPTSFSEKEALKENFWDVGEDARLREDFRFRQTPGGRWIISECLLANDELRKLFTQKHCSSLAFEDALAELDSSGDKKWVFCPADKRFVFGRENLRLSEQELTNSLLSEDAQDMEKYVSHLPIINLKTVAASEPEGEWGPTAQEDMGNILGWVRGSFHDPETGNYAVKKYMADQRDEEGRHGSVTLVSLNPDKEKYPDIELDPEDDQAVVVIAGHIKYIGDSIASQCPFQSGHTKLIIHGD